MGQNAKIIVNPNKVKEPLGDMFGIFFEDINHAADGGLYAELVRNRAFEFSSIDNNSYNPLTAWEKISGGVADLYVESTDYVNAQNPHYLVIDVKRSGHDVGVCNTGFNTGIPLVEKEKYSFSCYAKRNSDLDKPIVVSLRSESGEIYTSQEVIITSEWKKYELEFEAPKTDYSGRLAITVKGTGKVYLDFVSLFPVNTYKGRKNGMRNDLATLLDDMKPKFMRFPGGCLVHGGSLDDKDRDSMYRWKNTMGDIEGRPARRNNWSYHQTLGLGYYEYFQLCEDLGAKAIPVVPGGFNPHLREGYRAVPLDELQPYIDDALDLIEFANGDTSTVWGAKRAQFGHPEPFGLEYLAIGNEEVGEEFFVRYKIMHNIIKEKYPEIKLINTAGPFSGGRDYDIGWESARENKSDLIDEHYYQPKEWFLMNVHRYDSFKKDDPKVFLGEYASWGDTLHHALAEAAYMVMLERNAHAVSLACYAPLFCNFDYINWRTNLIWYNNHQSFGTVNYYVQKLFMNHQGDSLLDFTGIGLDLEPAEPKPVTGDIKITADRSAVECYDVKFTNDDNGETKKLDGVISLNAETKESLLGNIDWTNYTIELKAKKLEDIVEASSRMPGGRFPGGFSLQFGCSTDEKNKITLSVGGRGARIRELMNGGDMGLGDFPFSLEQNTEYTLKIKIAGRNIEVFVNGESCCKVESKPLLIEPLYYSASKEDKTGDIIVKAINVSDESRAVTVEIGDTELKNVIVYTMTSENLTDSNSLENPQKVAPVEKTIAISGSSFSYEFGKHSVNILRFQK